jgi:hypothetical protein
LPEVWGTGDDVYVLSCGKIYRRTGSSSDGGSSWEEEYADPDTSMRFEGATGTGPDDIWFVGSRSFGRCTVIVRKTAAGYAPVADSTLESPDACRDKPGLLNIKGTFQFAVHSPAKGRLVGALRNADPGKDVVRIVADASGHYSVTFSSPFPTYGVVLSAMWGLSEDDLWFIGSSSGFSAGSVLHGTNVWADGGVYEYSTLALNGSPNDQPLQRIRGTSNTNLWAVGGTRAFHKTTP